MLFSIDLALPQLSGEQTTAQLLLVFLQSSNLVAADPSELSVQDGSF